MSSPDSSADNVFLRRVLSADAVACVAMGTVLIVATESLSSYLNLPQLVQRGTDSVLAGCNHIVESEQAGERK